MIIEPADLVELIPAAEMGDFVSAIGKEMRYEDLAQATAEALFEDEKAAFLREFVKHLTLDQLDKAGVKLEGEVHEN